MSKKLDRATFLRRLLDEPKLISGSLAATVQNNDCRVLRLGFFTGSVAAHLLTGQPARPALLAVAGFAYGWLLQLGVKDVPAGILAERDRQADLFRKGWIGFDVSSPVPDASRKFRVLLEEAGEAAEAVDKVECAEAGANASIRRDYLGTELIQVAAVAVAWLESIEPREDKS
jgi:hypothetical protein